jgi:hypothetical protein
MFAARSGKLKCSYPQPRLADNSVAGRASAGTAGQKDATL